MSQTGVAHTGATPTGVREADGALVIGAATSLGELASLPLLERRLPVLAEAVALAARASGGSESLGAAVAPGTARDPGHAALCAALVVLGAELSLAGRDGAQVMPLEALSESGVDPADVVELRVPDPAFRSGGAVERADDGRCVAVQVSIGEAAVARSVRVAVAGPDRAPARAGAVERALMGRYPDDMVTRAAAARFTDDARAAECAARAMSRAARRALGD